MFKGVVLSLPLLLGKGFGVGETRGTVLYGYSKQKLKEKIENYSKVSFSSKLLVISKTYLILNFCYIIVLQIIIDFLTSSQISRLWIIPMSDNFHLGRCTRILDEILCLQMSQLGSVLMIDGDHLVSRYQLAIRCTSNKYLE